MVEARKPLGFYAPIPVQRVGGGGGQEGRGLGGPKTNAAVVGAFYDKSRIQQRVGYLPAQIGGAVVDFDGDVGRWQLADLLFN